jgi:hypothetical protein
MHAIVAGWDEPGCEHLLVHGGLEALIETLGFGGDIVGGHELRLNRDTELVRRVARKSEALGVVGDKFDSHDV